ncbi:MAG: hypothetical protein ABR998_10420 [Gemmatimonadales bacterium]
MNEEILGVLRENDSILEPAILVRDVTFRLARIESVPIRVRVWFDALNARDPYRFELSHYAHTPTQADSYVPSAPYEDSEERALRRAIRTLVDWVEGAERQGHTPDPSWLVPAGT